MGVIALTEACTKSTQCSTPHIISKQSRDAIKQANKYKSNMKIRNTYDDMHYSTALKRTAKIMHKADRSDQHGNIGDEMSGYETIDLCNTDISYCCARYSTCSLTYLLLLYVHEVKL